MSRERLMGSNGGPLGGILTSPGYAMIAQQGQQTTTQGPQLGFPFFFDAAGLGEFWGKNIEITADFNLVLSGNDGTDDWVFTRTCNDIVMTRPQRTEADMRLSNLAAFPPQWNTQETFIGTTNDRRNGVDNFGTVDFVPRLVMSDGAVPYFYRMDLARWLPRFTAEIQVILGPLLDAGHIQIRSGTVEPGSGQEAGAATGGTLNGMPFDCQITKPPWLTVTTFEFALRYSKFLPYAGTGGAIWDENTGRGLQSHSTPKD